MDSSGIWSRPIVTEIEDYKTFYPAEDYHQDFMAKNPTHRYIVRWDAPKVRALEVMFPADFRENFLRDASS